MMVMMMTWYDKNEDADAHGDDDDEHDDDDDDDDYDDGGDDHHHDGSDDHTDVHDDKGNHHDLDLIVNSGVFPFSHSATSNQNKLLQDLFASRIHLDHSILQNGLRSMVTFDSHYCHQWHQLLGAKFVEESSPWGIVTNNLCNQNPGTNLMCLFTSAKLLGSAEEWLRDEVMTFRPSAKLNLWNGFLKKFARSKHHLWAWSFEMILEPNLICTSNRM